MYDWLVNRIKAKEGFSGIPYEDLGGDWSIGYGRNLTQNPLSKEEASYLLGNDLLRVERELAMALPFWGGLDEVRKTALVEMCYNLGLTRFARFTKMLDALKNRDYERTAKEALDSKWAKQIGNRAKEIAFMLRTGEKPNAT